MPVTERCMGLGDWSLTLRADTPYAVRNSVSTPFSQLLVTRGRLPVATLTDSVALSSSMFTGVCLRPGPQFQLSGCGLQWFLGGSDATFGTGFVSSLSVAAGSLSTAVSTVLSGTGLSSGTVSAGTVAAYDGADVLRLNVLRQLADQLGFEYRLKPDLTVDVGSVSTLYGSTPKGVVVRRAGPKELATPVGVVGDVTSTWDYEDYASAVVVWTTSERATAGGASSYRGPGGALMTVYRGYEFADAPNGAAGGIATQMLSTVDRAYRTVEVTSSDWAVPANVPCGSSIYIYDVDLKLTDTANQVLFGGQVIRPASARVMSVTWPLQRGMGVYVRSHNGTSASFVDLSDWVEWESGDTRMEVSTAAQFLAPKQQKTLQDLWSPWQDYAVEWRAVTTNPTLGNGTLNGSFRRLGTSVDVRITLKIGSTSTGGVGAWAFTLPPGIQAKTQADSFQLGQAVYVDSSTGEAYSGGCHVRSAETTLYVNDGGSPWANVTADAGGVPFAWATNDTLSCNITLECDP